MKPAPFLLAATVLVTAIPPCCGQALEKCEYSLAFAIPRGKDGTINKDKSREIGEAFMALAKDATRGIAGGGRMEYDARRHVLVVSHTASGHEHVMHLLAAIRNLIDRENGIILALAGQATPIWRCWTNSRRKPPAVRTLENQHAKASSTFTSLGSLFRRRACVV